MGGSHVTFPGSRRSASGLGPRCRSRALCQALCSPSDNPDEARQRGRRGCERCRAAGCLPWRWRQEGDRRLSCACYVPGASRQAGPVLLMKRAVTACARHCHCWPVRPGRGSPVPCSGFERHVPGSVGPGEPSLGGRALPGSPSLCGSLDLGLYSQRFLSSFLDFPFSLQVLPEVRAPLAWAGSPFCAT